MPADSTSGKLPARFPAAHDGLVCTSTAFQVELFAAEHVLRSLPKGHAVGAFILHKHNVIRD